MFVQPMVTPLHKCPDCGRCGVKSWRDISQRSPKNVHYPDSSARLRKRSESPRFAAIDDIAVPRDPAHVSGAPVDVFGLQIENIFCRQVGEDHVTCGGVDDALWLTCCSARIKQEKHILGTISSPDSQLAGPNESVIPVITPSDCKGTGHHRHALR